MSIKRRLWKIETKIDMSKKATAPIMVFLCKEDNKESILRELRVKYGEDYKPPMVIICPVSKEEAKQQNRNFPYII